MSSSGTGTRSGFGPSGRQRQRIAANARRARTAQRGTGA